MLQNASGCFQFHNTTAQVRYMGFDLSSIGSEMNVMQLTVIISMDKKKRNETVKNATFSRFLYFLNGCFLIHQISIDNVVCTFWLIV